jgi:hypothetical protein
MKILKAKLASSSTGGGGGGGGGGGPGSPGGASEPDNASVYSGSEIAVRRNIEQIGSTRRKNLETAELEAANAREEVLLLTIHHY